MKNNDVTKTVSEKIRGRKAESKWHRAMSAIACVVVFCTVYSLILPAITLEASAESTFGQQTLYCRQTEHIHTDDCTEKTPVHELADNTGHKHSIKCYATLICEKPLQDGHSHRENCYTTNRVLTCEQTETAAHAHTEECMDTRPELICSFEKAEEHTHTADCVQTQYELACTLDKSTGHSHTSSCKKTEIVLSCTKAEADPAHTHTEGRDGCYTSVEKIVCGQEEATAHTHSQSCYKQTEITVCDKEETEGHSHTDDCYTDKQVLECKLTEAAHSRHTVNCYEYGESPLCGKEETAPAVHRHTDKSYETTVVCAESEHKHSLDCYVPPEILADLGGSRKNFNPVARTQELIDVLPTYEEFENMLLAYEEAEDWAGYEAYAMQIIEAANAAYVMYMDFDEEQQAVFTDIENMLDLHNFELPVPYDISTKTWPVFAVNLGWTDSVQSAVIVLDDTYTIGQLSSFSSLSNYRDWTVIVVNNKNVVTRIVEKGQKDSSLKAPSGGFLVIWHSSMTAFGASSTISCKAGDTVTFSGFNLSEQKRGGTSSTSIGTVRVSSGVTPADAVKKAYDIPTLDAVDMQDKIKVSLFDYSDIVNSEWYSKDAHYPGYQNPGGTKSMPASISLEDSNDFNYGDIITSDFGTINVAKTSATGKINRLNNSANKALNGAEYRVMAPTLINNKPAIVDGSTYDLGYLFTNNPARGVTQMNDKNITGLFQIDTDPASETYGDYYFDSRKNFAEFDEKTDTFTLYDAFFTPNYLMYPFGNFMPLNKIETTTTKVSEINSQRLAEISGYAAKLVESSTSTLSDNYMALAVNLNKFNELLDGRKSGWSGLDAADYYFAGSQMPESARPDYYGDEAKKATLENRLYNLDYDEESNFFFGMTIDFRFMQPKDGMYKSEHTPGTSLEAMKFNFAGDDDVWVYIDGVLLLDISGIHRHVGGTIDFKTGKVTYYPFKNWDGEVSDTAYLTETFADIFKRAGYTTGQLDEILIKDATGSYTTFKNYTNHSFKMYYMERGSGSSVCSINFNMPVIKDNTIGVMKQVQTTDGDTSYLGKPRYEFQIFKADARGNKTDQLLISPGTEFEVFDLYGQFLRTDTVGENGVFHIRADEIAEFPVPENAGKYFVRELVQEDISDRIKFVGVDGKEQTTDNTGSFPALSGFEGYDSNIKDISDGTTIFTYINTYDVDRFGGLAISKTVDGATDNFSGTFTFNLTFDGEKLPADTTYTLYDKNNKEIGTATVGADSTVTVGHRQTAVITGIAAGSRFKVQEIGTTQYSVTYSGEGIDVVGDYATGTILPAPAGKTNVATVKLNITNYVSDEEITIPVSKILNNFDGTDRTFKFRLEQVDSDGRLISDTTNIFYSSGNPAADTARYIEITPSAQSGETAMAGTGRFTVPLGFENLAEKGYLLPATLYFKVSEVDEGAPLVGYDSSSYIVAVPLSIRAGQLTAGDITITGGDSIVFTNTLLDSLKVSKTVIGGSENDEFTFTLKVNKGEFSDALVYTKGETKETLYADDTTSLYTFTLKDGEEITISNLPVGAGYEISETNSDGYYPAYRINSAEDYSFGNMATGTLTWLAGNVQVTDHVEFQNRARAKLPQAGGRGTALYTSGGVLLMGAGLILGYAIKKRRNCNN